VVEVTVIEVVIFVEEDVAVIYGVTEDTSGDKDAIWEAWAAHLIECLLIIYEEKLIVEVIIYKEVIDKEVICFNKELTITINTATDHVLAEDLSVGLATSIDVVVG